ncbi:MULTISPECIES: flagellar basal-body rod protein FlgG [Photobacterium]|uniref:Flagellar basal-body rod protein FlgG n=1 Tax=Photobacterium sanguinicancri TaxID=875932 RepID=A0ABX4G044_9GAMM|nr:flagellar basal-body rod protein FlgG [Photobacterium sanguinicancri]MDO6500183.1 flagellar basal-body rod protein FlgG [Photobacterium sanguinicancri]OZS44543.1 flagellar basal-body rod protein FlgG [Photobacterium sanguinicancri]
MHPALWVSKTGLAAQDTQMQVISNNLANVNTVGFKQDRAVFEDLFYQMKKQPGSMVDQQNEAPGGLQLGNGVRTVGTQKLMKTGSYQNTQEATDMAIMGAGFFQVELSDGTTAYTRNGQFHRNSEGALVNAAGLPMIPNIEIPENATGMSVGTDGMVSIKVQGEPEPQEIGQITLANFTNPSGLEAMGGNLFRESGASGAPIEGVGGEDGIGAISQFTLEGSNVSVVEEMVNMITTQRAYEMNAKVVSSADQMLKFVSQSM